MKKIVKAGFLISLLVIMGCARIPFFKSTAQPSTTPAKSDLQEEQTLEANEYVEKGWIVDGQRLQRGQNILIVPFTAGVGVEASNELDAVALMVIKGISDAFATDRSGKHDYFNILTAKNSQDADLVIQGHISGMKRPSKVSRWMLFKKQKILGIDGKMTDAKTGEVVLVFNDDAKTTMKTEDYKQLGYRIGKNAGLFILSAVK